MLWAQVAADVKRVLSELKKHPATVAAGPLTSAQGDGGATTVAFLSSPKLLRLQLQDATLRRIWLIQCLILFVSCRNPPKGKPRLMAKPVRSTTLLLLSLTARMLPCAKVLFCLK